MVTTAARIEQFLRKEGYEPQAYEVCPRFDRCCVNRCPLHHNYRKLQPDTTDQEKKCKCPKVVRREIASYFMLQNQGLTLKEQDNLRKSIALKNQLLFTKDKKIETQKTPIIGTGSGPESDLNGGDRT